MLFQRSTLEVRNFYRSQGFIPAEYPHVADDHLAIELDFMAQLALRMLEAAQANDEEVYKNSLVASREFLDEHLLKWVPQYVVDLQEEQAVFYPLVVRALQLFLQKDAGLLRAILIE